MSNNNFLIRDMSFKFSKSNFVVVEVRFSSQVANVDWIHILCLCACVCESTSAWRNWKKLKFHIFLLSLFNLFPYAQLFFIVRHFIWFLSLNAASFSIVDWQIEILFSFISIFNSIRFIVFASLSFSLSWVSWAQSLTENARRLTIWNWPSVCNRPFGIYSIFCAHKRIENKFKNSILNRSSTLFAAAQRVATFHALCEQPFLCYLQSFIRFLFGSFLCRYSVQEKILRNRNEDDRFSIRSANKLNGNELYDPNQNKYYKVNGNIVATRTPTASPMHNGNDGHSNHHHASNGFDANSNNSINGSSNRINMNGNGIAATPSAVLRERYQHPALMAIINESQGIKFRGKKKNEFVRVFSRFSRRHFHYINLHISFRFSILSFRRSFQFGYSTNSTTSYVQQQHFAKSTPTSDGSDANSCIAKG